MYVVGSNIKPYAPVLTKVKRGVAVLAFATMHDGNCYLQAPNGQCCTLVTLKEAFEQNPGTLLSINRVVYFNSSQAVELMLKNPDNFPYEEFLCSFDN